MAGKTLVPFLRAGLSKKNGWGDTSHLPSNWNLKYEYYIYKEEEACSWF